jgi:hypothetical protein
MEQLNAKESKGAIRHQSSEPPIPPERIWTLLTLQQQREVFQRLVGLCQELLSRRSPGEPEVPHESV